MKRHILVFLSASIIASTLTPSLYGITLNQARQTMANKFDQAKQKLREYQRTMSQMSNCALKGTLCSVDEQQKLRRKLAIGAAVVGTALAALTAAITTAVILSRRSKIPTEEEQQIPQEESIRQHLEEIPTIPKEQLTPQQNTVRKTAIEGVYKSVLQNDHKEVSFFFIRAREQKLPIVGELSQNFITPHGNMNLLTYAAITLDKPTVEALLKGGIPSILNEEVIQESLNSGLINANDPLYIEIRKIIEKAKKAQ